MKEVLKKLKPTKDEEKKIEGKIKSFLDKLNKNLNNERSMVGGSFAKGTWLKGNHDIDVFVMYENEKDISEKLEEALKRSFKEVIKVHGSRDYFNINFKGLNFEIVPVLRIKKSVEAKNITDVSPLHVKWVKSKLTSKLSDDIRLVKQFAKAQEVYGAETFVKGFSGYALEVLVLHYKGFEKLLKAAIKWKIKDVINTRRKEVILNKDKLSALIVIDPVQENRNTTAALSKEKFDKFVSSCRMYLKNPSESFFKVKKFDLKKVNKNDILLKAMPVEGTRDVVGTKLLKFYEKLLSRIKKEGFKVSSSGWAWDKFGYFWFSVKSLELAKFKEHAGPPLDIEEHVISFRAKHSKNKVIEKDGELFAIVPRKHTKFKNFVKYLLKEDVGIIGKVKKVEFIK